MRDRRAVRATSKARAGPRGSVRPRAYAQIHAAQPRAGDRAPMGSGKRAVLIEKCSYFGVSLEMGCGKVVVLIKWGSYFGVSLEMGCRKVAVLIVLEMHCVKLAVLMERASPKGGAAGAAPSPGSQS